MPQQLLLASRSCEQRNETAGARLPSGRFPKLFRRAAKSRTFVVGSTSSSESTSLKTSAIRIGMAATPCAMYFRAFWNCSGDAAGRCFGTSKTAVFSTPPAFPRKSRTPGLFFSLCALLLFPLATSGHREKGVDPRESCSGEYNRHRDRFCILSTEDRKITPNVY